MVEALQRARVLIVLFFLFILGAPFLLKAQTASSTDSVRIDRVLVTGNKRTKRYIILRELEFRPGSTVSRRDLKLARERLLNLYLFNAVDFHILKFQSETVLKIVVVERWTIFPLPVLQFHEHSFSKIAYGGGVADYNFLGRAQQIFILGWAGFNPGVQFYYGNHWFGGSKRFFAKLWLNSIKETNHTQIFEDLNARTLRALLKVGKRFGPYRQIGLNVAAEQLRLSDRRAALSASGTDKILSAGMSFQLDTRDLHYFPSRGNFFRFEATKNWILRQGQFWQTEVDARHYFPWHRLILAVRAEGEFLVGTVPVYRHIFLGYGERIRGHFTDVAEGKARAQAAAGLRFPLMARRYVNLSRSLPALQKLEFGLYGTVFGNAGVIWPGQPHWGSGQTQRGAGVGLNFILPYSSVFRTELAWNESLHREFIADMVVAF